MKKYLPLLAMVFSLLACQLQTQTSDYHAVTDFDTIFVSNAPKRITRNIKLDREGRLLMAAYDDIVRYDGDSFTSLKKPTGTGSWFAFDVLEDKNGNVWIASDQSGAFRIDSKTGAVSNFTPKDGLGHVRNMCVYEDKSGNIWIGGQGGLSRYDGAEFKTFTTKDGLPHNDINTILEDHEGNIWVGTRGNAGIYNGITFSTLKNNEGDCFFNVWSIVEDQSNTIRLVDSSGLWSFKDKIFTYESPDIWKIYEDKEGHFWCTSMLKGGASTLKRLEGNFTVNGGSAVREIFRSEKMLFGLVQDNEGKIWIGGGDGIWAYDGTIATYYTGVVHQNE